MKSKDGLRMCAPLATYVACVVGFTGCLCREVADSGGRAPEDRLSTARAVEGRSSYPFTPTLELLRSFKDAPDETGLASDVHLPVARIGRGERALEALFGASAQCWLNLQLAWGLYHAQHAPDVEKVRKQIK